jgi:hypothetical protein
MQNLLLAMSQELFFIFILFIIILVFLHIYIVEAAILFSCSVISAEKEVSSENCPMHRQQVQQWAIFQFTLRLQS